MIKNEDNAYHVTYWYFEEEDREMIGREGINSVSGKLGTILIGCLEYLGVKLNLVELKQCNVDVQNLKENDLIQFIKDEHKKRKFIKFFDRFYEYQDTEEIDKAIEIINFISICTENKEMCDLKHLIQFATMIARPLVNRSLSLTDKHIGYLHRKLTYEDIKELLVSYNKENKTLENIKILAELEGKKRSHGVTLEQREINFIKPPKAIIGFKYEIENLSNLLLALLQELFVQNKIIRKCKNCSKYFIPKYRNNEEYCGYESTIYGKSCKEEAKIKRQSMWDNSTDSRIIHKRYRTMLAARVNAKNITEEERAIRRKTQDSFIKETRIIRDYIKEKGLYIEDEYINWMHRFYNKRFEIDKIGYHEDTKEMIIKDMNKIYLEND